jgi:hypothetical protein
MAVKSPFIIRPDFLSPLMCERILADLDTTPNFDVEGDPLKLERHNLAWEQTIIDAFHEVVPEIEERYSCVYRGLEKPLFQLYPENAKVPAEQPGCANSKYIRKRWVQTRDIDLVGFIWLKDFNSSVPLDPRVEVFGGKLEFPAYNFSLVPQKGTLVMFPAGPHFITVTSPILLGSLQQVKLTVSVKTTEGGQWFYQPTNFPGKWQDWLNEHL